MIRSRVLIVTATSNKNQNRGANGGHGMNWIAPQKRLAIYLRDGCACAYCGDALETGAELTLDHLDAIHAPGHHGQGNLITACRRCNSARGNRPVRQFAKVAAAYVNHGRTAARIMAQIARQTARPIDVATAREMIARRGNFGGAMAALKS